MASAGAADQNFPVAHFAFWAFSRQKRISTAQIKYPNRGIAEKQARKKCTIASLWTMICVLDAGAR